MRLAARRLDLADEPDQLGRLGEHGLVRALQLEPHAALALLRVELRLLRARPLHLLPQRPRPLLKVAHLRRPLVDRLLVLGDLLVRRLRLVHRALERLPARLVLLERRRRLLERRVALLLHVGVDDVVERAHRVLEHLRGRRDRLVAVPALVAAVDALGRDDRDAAALLAVQKLRERLDVLGGLLGPEQHLVH